MSTTKTKRSPKRQKGQFITPPRLARELLSDIDFCATDRALEPGFGDGSFLIPLIESFLDLYEGSLTERLDKVLNKHVWGIEVDVDMYDVALANIRERIGPLPDSHNLLLGDFLATDFEGPDFRVDPITGALVTSREFTHIVGNPPFGGTIASHLQDPLDKVLGWRHGMKIKKETYSWFIVKCMDLLAVDGLLRFICSDTFLTISTMRGLRHALAIEGRPKIQTLGHFSEETSYPMLVLDWIKGHPTQYILRDGHPISMEDISRTKNLSWGLDADLVSYFRGPVIGDVMVATSGMTTGNNSLFIRQAVDQTITENYDFRFADVPVSLEREIERARLGKLSRRAIRRFQEMEARGATQRELTPIERSTPLVIDLPHKDYAPYNKATRDIVYSKPTHYIYWKDDGDAVITYKKTGKWYLRGVGGAPYFGREGLTWRLISHSLDVRFLPAGHILDSGAPCAFPRPGVSREEMLFIMGWTLTNKCTQILKQVINHTMNIQSKDFERLPYPGWVADDDRSEAIGLVESMIDEGVAGRDFSRADREFAALESLFRMT